MTNFWSLPREPSAIHTYYCKSSSEILGCRFYTQPSTGLGSSFEVLPPLVENAYTLEIEPGKVKNDKDNSEIHLPRPHLCGGPCYFPNHSKCLSLLSLSIPACFWLNCSTICSNNLKHTQTVYSSHSWL